MMSVLKKVLYSVALLLILLAGFVAFLVFTTPGLYTSLRICKLFLPGSLSVQQLEGRLYDSFTVAELVYKKELSTVTIKNLKMDWHLLHILQPQLLVKRFSADSITLDAQTLNQVMLDGEFSKQLIKINSLTFGYLGQHINGYLQLMPQAPYTVSGTFHLNSDASLSKILRGSLNVSGDMNDFQCTGDFNGLGNISINGNLQKLMIFNLIVKWRNLLWSSATDLFGSPEGRLKLWGSFPQVNAELTSKIHQGQQANWQFNSTVQGKLPWQWNFAAQLSQPLTTSKKEGLYTSFSAIGALSDQQHGNLALTIQPGHYQLPEGSMISSLEFKGGVINALLSPGQLRGSGSLTIDPNKKLDLNFNLPEFDLNKGVGSDQPFKADLSLIFNSFDFLKNVSSEIKNPQGRLTLALKSQGTIAKPTIETQLNLSKASVTLPQLGLDLNNIELNLNAKGKKWDALGSLTSANKKLSINGQGPLSPQPSGEVLINGTDFPLMNTKEYQITVSPQLKLNFNASSLNITGNILVPYAQIKPHTFTNSISLPDDVVFKTKETAAPSLFNTNMDVKIVMGEKVELTFKGLHALLAGDVHIKQLPQGPINATGELNVTKGEYKAYGQNLSIEQGEVIFTGGRLDNPGINLRASKEINTTNTQTSSSNQIFDFNNSNLQDATIRGNITVGVEVSGQISSPKIQLFSNPSILSQADILSMLVLGRPASQANKAGGQLLLAAISSMNLGNGTNGTQLLEQLKNTLGFDFNVQTNSNYNIQTNQVSDTTGFVVGKSLSKRIYLSYNVGLSQTDPNVLTLKYLLNKFFSIQVSSSDTSNGIDFLYTSSSKDKVHE